LGRGSVAIADNAYSISGEAKDAAAYANILDQNAHGLPAGLTLKTANIAPPRVSPYRFVAERRDSLITIGGNIARTEDRQTVLATARRFTTTEVTDGLVIAAGAPAGFVAAATAAVRSLGRLATGKIEIVDQSVSISGTAYQPAAVNDIANGLRDALPTGFTLAVVSVLAPERGQPLTPAACRDQLQTVLQAGRIEFDANNPVITTDSLGTLDRVSATMLRCPDAAIEVGVHSDNDGTPSALHDRTQARADALMDYLVRAGVRRERLTAVGYGATKPIADNATAAGQAANRRVEFTVAVPSNG
jgi:OOP family OmpA-OmpF porin